MKKIAAVLGCVLISFCCLFSVSCGNGGNQSVFAFLSVRMKGNGDGTVTAIAQNEFALFPSVLPVTLTLYFSEEPQTDVGNMTEICSISSDDLNVFKKLEISAEVEEEAYYCASICYGINGEMRYGKSETVHYGTNGKRIK